VSDLPRYYKIMCTGKRARSRGGSLACFPWNFLILALAAGSAWGATPERVWRPIGPFGGGAEVVAVDPSQPERIYTLTKNSFLYRSDDEGHNWNLIRFPAQQGASAHALVINPSNTQEIWIAVSSGNSAAQGIYRTTDGGASWLHVEGLKGESVFSLALFSKDTRIMAAGARDGVHLSRDGGVTWTLISPLENKELQPVMSLAFDPRNDRILYVGTPHLPWKTEDAGATWRSIHHGMLDDSDILSLIVNPKQPNQLFIGACSGIYRSENSAGMWTKMLGITGAGYRTYSVAQDPSNPNIIYSGTRDGLWKSSDGGKSWHKTSPHIVKSIAISPADSRKIYLATQDAGMLRSEDGGETIIEALDGFADHRLDQVNADGHSIYVTGGQDTQAWKIAADSIHKGHHAWHKMVFPPAFQGQRISVSTFATSVYALGGGAIFRSADQGVNWSRLAPAGAPTTHVAVLAERELIASTSKTLYRSADSGVTWKALPPISESGPAVRIFSTTGNRNFVVETSSGFRLYREGGQTSEKIPLPIRPSEVNDLVFTAGNGLIAATSQGVYRSPDGGATWQLITKGIDAGTVASIASGASALFAAQYGKVFRSDDAGESWTEISNEGLDESAILRLTVSPSGSLIALTPSRGVFVFEDHRPKEAAAASTSGSPIESKSKE
jgi:photosystem II stability/assembly factor-like uncharacterized protein